MIEGREKEWTNKSEYYDFRTEWFEFNARPVWDHLLPAMKNLEKALEIGSFEGNSACYLIDNAKGPFDLTCIDSWEGAEGIIHEKLDMEGAEKRFHENTKRAIDRAQNPIKLRVLKQRSDIALAQLLVEGKSYDLVYVDANHEAEQALYDALLAYRLTNIGGVIVFDDYTTFYNDTSDTESPHPKSYTQDCKTGIDTFVNLNLGRLNILTAPLRQLFVQKVS